MIDTETEGSESSIKLVKGGYVPNNIYEMHLTYEITQTSNRINNGVEERIANRA